MFPETDSQKNAAELEKYDSPRAANAVEFSTPMKLTNHMGAVEKSTAGAPAKSRSTGRVDESHGKLGSNFVLKEYLASPAVLFED